MSKEELINLANYDVSKRIDKNKNWSNFLDVYKTKNGRLEILQNVDAFKFVFEMGNEKLDSLWGEGEPEKLKNLKDLRNE